MPHRGLYESGKQRVRPGGLRLEFRMILYSDKPGMGGNFNNLDKRSIGTQTRRAQPVGFELLAIGIVKLIAVAVPLGNCLGTIAFGGLASRS